MSEPGAAARIRERRLPAGRTAAVTLVLLALIAGGGYMWLGGSEPRGTAIGSGSGDLMAVVRRLVRSMPGPGSGTYQRPSAAQESTMAAAARMISQGRAEEAVAIVEPLGYLVERFRDTATGRTLILLRPSASATARGWGLFAFAPGSSSRLIVEIAHPYDDIESWIVGVDAFRDGGARALLVAGASRFAAPEEASDVAHDLYTVFEGIHEALLTPRSIVFEPHGFETDGHQDYGDVVVSNGAGTPDPLIDAVAERLRAAGLSVCVYDGIRCGALGATTNVQGTSTRAAGATFVHIEMSSAVRSDAERARAVAGAVAAVTAGA